MCRFISAAEVNEEAHIGHLWVFSPPFFILVLDVRGIVQLSAEHWLSVFIKISSFISISSALYQSYGLTEDKYQESPKENNSGKSESELKYLHNESESEDKG